MNLPTPGYPAVVEERYESELAQSTNVLDDVDRALERLSEGTYHSCEVCGATIADPDLATDPTDRVCSQHSAPALPAASAPPDAADAADALFGAPGRETETH